jgi:hypothetical protein
MMVRSSADRLAFREPPQLPFARGVLVAEPSGGGRFAERNPLNVPGMFYGAETDTCNTGPFEAPDNVVLDGNHQEFVFRQPRDVAELAMLFNAVAVECFDGYGTDGNAHWTPALVRAWWAGRDQIREAWRAAGVPAVDEVFERELPRYLRGYLFFLEHGRAPSDDEICPTL